MIIFGYLAFLVLAVAALILGICYYRNPTANMKTRLRWLIIIMAVASIVMTIGGIIELQAQLAPRQWPSTEGQIIASEVAGDRAFHPVITYSYSVEGQTYSHTSILNTPGFGGKRIAP